VFFEVLTGKKKKEFYSLWSNLSSVPPLVIPTHLQPTEKKKKKKQLSISAT